MALRMMEATEDYKQKNLSLARINAFFQPLMGFLIGLSTVITVLAGGYMVSKGELTIGNIAEFVIYVNILTWPVTSIGWITSLTQQAAASQKRINEYLAQKPAWNNGVVLPPSQIQSIEFAHVSFVYSDTGIEALKDLNLEFKKGNKTAIVGKSGAGKSSIAELIVRMYDPTGGVISINGIPLPEFEISALRSKIGYVTQDIFLFSDSIYHNIDIRQDGKPLDEIIRVAKIAGLHDEIVAFPEGYETLIGERGVLLSGGQKQRLSLARTLLFDPQVIILDDSLSALDAITEANIGEYLQNHWQERIVVVITHRAVSPIKFDRIYCIDQGKVEDFGTPDELLTRQNFYKKIFDIQNSDASVNEKNRDLFA